MDADDGNWLRVSAHCGSSGASVLVNGAILFVTDLVRWGEQCALLHRGTIAQAELVTLEPELAARIDSPDKLGHLRLRVEITPDYVHQKHVFEFQIDQSYLPALIAQCEQIEQAYPVRGTPDT